MLKRASLLCSVLLLVACADEGDHPISGIWSGPLEHNGQTSTFALRLEARGDSVDVAVSMPAIGVFDVPVGRAVLRDGALAIGSQSLAYDASARTISGVVPSALLPAYTVPFVLRPAESLPEGPPAPAPAPELRPLWAVDAGAPVWAGLAASEGVVFAGTDAGRVLAVTEADGSVRWSSKLGGAVRATPTLVDGALLVHADDGSVTSIDAATGAGRWVTSIAEPVERIPPGQAGSRYVSYASSVVATPQGLVVGTPAGEIVALEASSGRVLWRHPAQGEVVSTPTVSADGGLLYFTTFEGEVVALDLPSQRETWRWTTAGQIVSSPALAPGALVVGNRAYDVLGLDPADGSLVWTHYYWWSWVESSAAVRGETVVVGSSDAQRLTALNGVSGSLLWTVSTGGSTWAKPALSDTHAYIGSVGVADYMVDHQARFQAVDLATGETTGRFALERPGDAGLWGFASSPVVGHSAVHVASVSGTIYAFPLR